MRTGNIKFPSSADDEQDWQPYGCRAGLTLERCSQLAVFTIQLSVETRRRYDWLGMVLPCARLFPAREVWRHARDGEYCAGEPGSTLSGGYAPDSAKVEGSSIVDEPGGC